jgi:arylsulfatase A-like enzyme
MNINQKIILYCFFVSLLFLMNIGCKKQTVPDKKPNIIIVLADDQGWGDMGYYRHPVLKTPNFDSMSESGLRFDRFYAAAPVCSPTRGSIMTGRHPNRFGCFSWGYTLRPREITLAEALRKAGYVTGHFGKWHIGHVYKGSPVNPGNSGFDEWFSAPNFFDNDPVLSREGTAVMTNGESSMVTIDTAIDFIGKYKDASSPFFAYICFGSPHNPHIAAERFKELYPGQDEKLKNFYGEISGMDHAFGKLRQKIRDMGIVDNTVLWYLSDNGGLPGLGMTGGREHKGSIYEGGLRVPSIIEWPDMITKPGIINIPCGTVDIYPTILEIAGVGINDQPVLDGISLVPLIKGNMEKRPEPLGFWKYPADGIRTPSNEIMTELLEIQQSGKEVDPSKLLPGAGETDKEYAEDIFPGHAAWLDWPYKLHRIHDDNDEVKYELYNLENDPLEKDDLSENDPDRLETMSGQIEKWMGSVVGSLNGNDYKN